jgi:hypothetical protein
VEPVEKLYVIGLGNAEDAKAGRASLYYLNDSRGDTGLPVFSSRERLFRYVEANFHKPEVHIKLLDSIDPKAVALLTEGRYSAVTLDTEEVAR